MNKNEFLLKHTKIDYLQQCLRHFNDRQFIDTVNAINRDPNLLYFTKNGELYSDILFYDIFLDYPSKGFFALFLQTLDALRYAERFHLTPVVTWSERCLYKVDQPINGTNNPFCYYFEPVSIFNREDIFKAFYVLPYKDSQRALDRKHPFGVVSKTIMDNNIYDEYINMNAIIYKKYIRMNNTVQQLLDSCLVEIGFEGNVLGVHVRATDFKKGYVNHAQFVGHHEYIEHVKIALKKQHFDYIFLATDDISVIEEFKIEFGSKVLYCHDVCRSSDGNAVHFGTNTTWNHKYKLGIEVIRDMYILSCCSGLIGGFSNVCIMAQIAKKSRGIEFEYLDVINKGFNSVGKTTYQDHYK